MNHDQDDLSALLRDAMREETSHVVPSGDALAKIRSRVATRRGRFGWFLRPAVAASALVAALLGGTGIGFLLAGEDTQIIGPTRTAGPTPSVSAPASPSSTSKGSPPSSPGPTSGSGTTAAPPPSRSFAAPVYWLGDTDGQLKLYREYFSVPSGTDKGRAALTAMLEHEPYDGDYLAVWPRGTRVLGLDRAGGVATVNLSAEALRKHAPPETAEMAVQQLVWTLTGADQDGAERLRLLVDGQPVRDLWGSGLSVVDPVGRSTGLDVLANVWITDPPDGATVGRTVKLAGQATVFEANVTIQVRQGSTLIRDTFATASLGAPGRGEWSKTLTLPPGSYEIKAFEASAQDGRPLAVDTKSVTVR
jgi:spore germination protein GerM